MGISVPYFTEDKQEAHADCGVGLSPVSCLPDSASSAAWTSIKVRQIMYRKGDSPRGVLIRSGIQLYQSWPQIPFSWADFMETLWSWKRAAKACTSSNSQPRGSQGGWAGARKRQLCSGHLCQPPAPAMAPVFLSSLFPACFKQDRACPWLSCLSKGVWLQ